MNEGPYGNDVAELVLVAAAEIAVASAVFLLVARSRSDRLLGGAWLGPALVAAPTIVAQAEQVVYRVARTEAGTVAHSGQ